MSAYFMIVFHTIALCYIRHIDLDFPTLSLYKSRTFVCRPRPHPPEREQNQWAPWVWFSSSDVEETLSGCPKAVYVWGMKGSDSHS